MAALAVVVGPHTTVTVFGAKLVERMAGQNG
jgi:hypothetical protein